MERDPEAGSTVVISQRPEGRRAGFEGLVNCGSVWACPVCAAKIAPKRAEELAQVLDAVQARGGSSFMLTLTIKHSAGDRLGLSKDERARRHVLDRRRRWRNRLDKIDQQRMDREVAEAKRWNVDEHAADADDIAETDTRKQIAKTDPEFICVGRAGRTQREADTAELDDINSRRGCWDAVTDAWAAATGGRDWADGQDEAGLLGWVRVTEVTDGGTPAILAGLAQGHGYSGNGWHVHVHALLCFAGDLSEEYMAAKLAAGMHARWARKARQLGFDSSVEHGWDLRKTQPRRRQQHPRLLVKQAHEVTGGHRKEGRRRGGRTPMRLLADAVETYRVEDLTRWWVYETVAEGRHQLEWSRGARSLRALAGLGVEQSDERVAEETLDGEDRLRLPRETSQWLRVHRAHLALLDVAELGGLDAARIWLAHRVEAARGPRVASGERLLPNGRIAPSGGPFGRFS